MAIFKGFTCKYCGRHVSWNSDKGPRPPAQATSSTNAPNPPTNVITTRKTKPKITRSPKLRGA